MESTINQPATASKAAKKRIVNRSEKRIEALWSQAKKFPEDAFLMYRDRWKRRFRYTGHISPAVYKKGSSLRSGLLAMAAVVVLAGILALCIPDVARSPNRESAIASAVDEAS